MIDGSDKSIFYLSFNIQIRFGVNHHIHNSQMTFFYRYMQCIIAILSALTTKMLKT